MTPEQEQKWYAAANSSFLRRIKPRTMTFSRGDVVQIKPCAQHYGGEFGVVAADDGDVHVNLDGTSVCFRYNRDLLHKIGVADMRQITIDSTPRKGGRNAPHGMHAYLVELQQSGWAPKRILDVGANVGQFSNFCRTLWPDSHITAIEPGPAAHRIKADIVIRTLLHNHDGEVEYFTNPYDPMCERNTIYKEATDQVPVLTTCKRLDRVVSGPFDFIKLDTQGAELDIINGGPSIISQAEMVLCELPGPRPVNKGAPTRREVEDRMAELGFRRQVQLEWWWVLETQELANVDVAFWRD